MTKTMKIVELSDDQITFDNGHVLAFFHEQECCEEVFADCENIQAMNNINTPIYEAEFDCSLPYELVDGVGISLINTYNMKYLISCYDIQNGYYSSNLTAYLFTKEQFQNVDLANWRFTTTNDYIWTIGDVEKSDKIN